MSDESRQIEFLTAELTLLTERVDDLERALAERTSAAAGHPRLFAEQAAAAASPPPTPRPTPAPAAQARPVERRPVQPPPPPPPPPFDWGKLAEQVFAARTLAWAGGVATVLGIIL